MGKALIVEVNETLPELKKIYKSAAMHQKQKVQMLLTIKKSSKTYSKNDLAKILGVDPNSIQNWRKKYITGGVSLLLKDGRIGFKPKLLNAKQHAKVLAKLNNPKAAFGSFKELQTWMNSTFKKDFNYNSLRHYVKRHFGAKMKVARKSHIHKDENAVALFKKTLVKPATK